MAERCSCCRRWEEHVYSNRLTRARKFHFFKVLLGDFAHHLSIPKKFVILFQKNLPETVELKDTSGKRWPVKLNKTDGRIFFEDGWEEFVKDHSLEVGYFLVFRFNGDSCFRVLIFDSSACENENVCSCEKQKKRNTCAENPVKVEEREDSDDVQLVPVPIREIGFNNVQAAPPRATNLESCQNCSEMVRKVLEEENNSRKDFQEATQEQAIHQMVRPSRKRMVCPDDHQDSSKKQRGDSRSGHLATKVDYTSSWSIKADPEEIANSSRKRKYRAYPQHFISNRRPVTEEEKKRAFQLAAAVKPIHPAFISILKPTHVYRKFFLAVLDNLTLLQTVPKEFASGFFYGHNNHRIILHTTAGEWEVHCTRYNKIYGISLGWKEFVVGNNLEEGDVLIFEFASRRGLERMNVRIFRVVENVVPPVVVDNRR